MLDNSNFIRCVDYNTHENYSCETSGCEEEGICRCSTIEEVYINSINTKRLAIDIFDRIGEHTESNIRNKKLIQVLWDYEYDFVNHYCIERILSINQVWNTNNWFPLISAGYYGEELEDILIQRELFDKLVEQIQNVLEIDRFEKKIYYLLELEYGKVLDNLIDKKMSIQIIDYDQITFPQKSHYEKVKSKNLDHINYTYTGIKGIVRKVGTEYRVVDGYHRLVSNLLKKVKVIVVE
jgi:hypothetical protein